MRRLILVTLSIIVPVVAMCASGTVTLPPYVTNSRFGAHSSANQADLGGKLSVDRFTRYSSVHLSGGFGPQGEQGPQGERGFRGYSGATGAQGPQGLTGAQGPQGIQGEVGPQGLQGPAGADGPIGPSNASFQNHSSQTTTAHGGIHNVPAGGTSGQKLVKTADTDYATGWSTDTDAYLPLTGGIIKPAVNSTTTLQVQKADTTTPVLNVDTTNGRVGIGTATPTQILNVVGGTNSAVLYTAGYQNRFNSTTDAVRFVFIPGNGVQHAVQDMYNASTQKTISFNAGSDSYFNGGNVGIGTTTPATKIHGFTNNTVVDGVTNILTLDHDITGTPAAGAGTGINFLTGTTTTASQQSGNIAAVWTDATYATRKSKLSFSTTNDGTVAERMTLDSGGNLAITGQLTTGNRVRHIQLDAKLAGLPANQPGQDAVGSAAVLTFPSAGTKYAYVQWEIPSDWVPGTDITFEVDWTPWSDSMAGTDAVKWDIAYGTRAVGEAVNGTLTTVSATIDADVARYVTTHSPVTFVATDTNNPLTHEDHIFIRVARDTAVANDYAGDVGIFAFELIYTSNGIPET